MNLMYELSRFVRCAGLCRFLPILRDAEVAGSNPVAPTYREPLCIKGSFLVCLNFSTLKFARCQDYVKIFGGILRKTHPSLLAVPWKRHPSALSDVDIQSEIDVYACSFCWKKNIT